MGCTCADAHEPHGSCGDRTQRQSEGEQHAEHGRGAEHHAGADHARARHERRRHRRAEHAAGVPEVVERPVDRRAPVREVEDADVGEAQQRRADRDPHGRRLAPRAFELVGDGWRAGLVRRPPAVAEQQQHREARAREGHRHPGAPEDRAGARREPVADRPGKPGHEPQRRERAEDEEPEGGGVGAVTDELATGGGTPAPPAARPAGRRAAGGGPPALRRGAAGARSRAGHGPNGNTGITDHRSTVGHARAGRAERSVRPP